MATVMSIPEDVLVDNLFLIPSTRDLLSLGSINHALYRLTSQEVLWKRKCECDFNYVSTLSVRLTGWKAMYKELQRAKVFVWGCSDYGALGLPASRIQQTVAVANGIPYPVQLHIPGARIKKLASSAWSTHALDAEGRVFVWGTLDSFANTEFTGVYDPGWIAEKPHLLQLPRKVMKISCGRKHSVALDEDSNIWIFLSWGSPILVRNPFREEADKIIQVECGFAFCAALTHAGKVMVWWPFEYDKLPPGFVAVGGFSIYETGIYMMTQEGAGAESNAEVIPCAPRILRRCCFSPQLLANIPNHSLPPLGHASGTDAPGRTSLDSNIRLVKIAAMNHSLVGLTNMGHVLIFHGLTSDSANFSQHLQWEYLPFFSETEKVRGHFAFAQSVEGENVQFVPPSLVHITNISANHRTFTAYSTPSSSSHIALMGNIYTRTSLLPEILPSLLNHSIVSVARGNHSHAAVSSDGRLFTWGHYSAGALGLGDPSRIPVGSPGTFLDDHALSHVPSPSEVGFGRDGLLNKRKNRFVLDVSVAGLHASALVNGFDGDEDDT